MPGCSLIPVKKKMGRPKAKELLIPVRVMLRLETLSKLREIAERRDLSVSQTMRHALQHYVDEEAAKP